MFVGRIVAFVVFFSTIFAQTGEEFRPLFHYSPKHNWMNDPNGLVYYDREWHLFYQHYPREPKAKNIHWGHAVSSDLIHWTELPIALTPEDENVGIWSGSAVIDYLNVTGFQREQQVHPIIAIYTWQKRGWQEQHMAYSIDQGRTWTKYNSNPIMPLNVNVSFPTDTDLDASIVVFRDPKVMFHVPSNAWIAAISGGDHIQFHRSTDLIHWTLISRFGFTHGSHAGIWECPDLIEFPSNGSSLWVLIVSIDRNAVAGGSGTQYFVGTFDGYRFENLQSPRKTQWIDYGPDYYAGITYSNVPRYDNRHIMIAWMNNWQYAQFVPTAPMWRGQMAIPRELELDRTNFHLRQMPVRELYSSSKKLLTFPRQALSSCTPNVLDNLFVSRSMLFTEFHRITRETILHFRFRQNSNRTEYTQITYIGETNHLEFDRSQSGQIDFHPLFRTHYNMTLDEEILTAGILQIQILLDQCSVEIFVNHGQSALTALIFPSFESYRMELSVDSDDEIELNTLELMLL